MQIIKCMACEENDVEVNDDYEPRICCNGQDCCCRGKPVNPVFCGKCMEKMYGKHENED